MSAIKGKRVLEGWNAGQGKSERKRSVMRLTARARLASRHPRVQRFGTRERRGEGRLEGRRQQENLVTPGRRDITHMHGEEVYPCFNELARVVPALFGALIVAVMLLTARLNPLGNNNQEGGQYQSGLASMMLAMALVRAAGLLPAMKTTRQAPKRANKLGFKEILGAALLVAGGTVGAGIVALPVKTSSVGLLPSAAGLIGGWAYMLLAAFQIVDVTEYCGAGANFTTMAGYTLGAQWKAVSVALYVFVYCATLTAYIAESATFTAAPVAGLLGHAPPPAILSILFTAVFGGVIGLGPKVVDGVNSLCVVAALTAFGVLMWVGGTGLQMEALLCSNWTGALHTVPIMIVAFTFHNMIPSLFQQLRSSAAVKVALSIGTLIPLAMYLAWEVLILGSLPPGTRLGSVGEVVQMMGGIGAVPIAINMFSLFAIVTSFLGVGMGCIDFAQDLMGASREGRSDKKRSWLAVLTTLGVPLLIGGLCPELFVPALEISGMLRLVLFAVIPGMMLRAGPLHQSRGKKVWVTWAVGVIAVGIMGIDVVGRVAPIFHH